MRKIKFRAWIPAGGNARYIYSSAPDTEFLFSGDEIICFENYYCRTTIDPENIEFFCGLDDNGEECYEGDYLKIVAPDGEGGVTDFLSDRPLVLESDLGRPSIDGRSRPVNYCKLVLDKERSRRND